MAATFVEGVLWKLWKWVVHLFTGTCEIYRICSSTISLEQKAKRVEKSLRRSNSAALHSVAIITHLSISEAVEIVLKEKHIKVTKYPDFERELQPVLARVRGVRLFLGEVEQLRTQPFSRDNQQHEDMLTELWSKLNPELPLESRITKQWTAIGFQGNDPATDFRGMGVLSLHCLNHFSTHHYDRARALLSHSHHPTYGYPYALVGISMTSLAYSWLEAGKINGYLYKTGIQWPIAVEQFYDIFCYLYVEFDSYWRRKEPENVMEFSRIRQEFSEQMIDKLNSDDCLVMELK